MMISPLPKAGGYNLLITRVTWTMIQRIKALFSAPVFEGDLEKTLKSRELNNILNILLIGMVIFTILMPVFAAGWPPCWYFVLPLYLIYLGGQWLMRSGHVRAASRVLVLGMWLSVTAAEVTQGGVKAPAFAGNIVVILGAAILDGFGQAVAYLALTLVKGLLLILADEFGYLPHAVELAYSNRLILLTQMFIATMVTALLRMATMGMRVSLAHAHRELVERRLMEKSLLESEQRFRQLYETTQKQTQELALVGQVRTAMAQELDLPILLRNVVESIAASFGYTLVSIYLLEGDTLCLQHQVGYAKTIPKIALSQGVIGRSVRSGKPILLEDVRTEPEFLGAIENLVSEICIPLFDEGHAVGALNVESTHDTKLTESDLKLLTGLGEHISLAIRQARLYSGLQRRNRILSALEESTLVLMSRLELNEVLRTVVSQAAQIMDTSHGFLYLVQPDEQTLQMTVGTGVYADSIGKNLKPREGLAGKVWMSGQPLNIPHYQAWAGRSLQFNGIDFHAVAGVPLTSQSRVVGVLGLAHLEPGRSFSEEDIELLSHFARLASVALENGRLYSMVQQELADRKRAEEALKEAETLYRTLVETTSIVAYRDKPDELGSSLYISPQIERLLGYTPEEWLSRPTFWTTLVHPDDRSRVEEDVSRYVTKKDRSSVEYRMRTKAGEWRWVQDETVIVRDQAGVPQYIHGVFIDLTELKQAEQEREQLIADLENKNAELERYAYAVSHDLKSPLVTIRGFLGFVEQDSHAGDFVRLEADIQRIKDATDRMQHLLGELTELARVGHMTNCFESIPFRDLAQEALSLVHGRLEAGGIKVSLQPNLPEVYGDRPRLVEALQNLLENAAKYMDSQPNPEIEIGVRRDADSDIFFVRDNGMGIDPQYHAKVFELFEKLDANAAGTGIGLAIVKRIIEMHGGRIWIESRVGEGATFFFTLGNVAIR
ncbi:MAG: GAF domain-containing protein [Chloroflexi bacterium]|nr:GAF domain-containing protein [Chloroflexota bacterium]